MKIAPCIVFVLLFLAQNPAKKPDRSDSQSQQKPNDTSCAPVVVNCDGGTRAVAANNRKETPERDASVQWSNWALVVVAGITGYVIWMQAVETRRAAKAAEQSIAQQGEHFRLEQRAWVGASGEIIERDGAVIKFRIIIKNTGPTPALDVVVEPGLAFKGRDYLIPDDLSPERKSRLQMDKGADKESRYTVLPNDTSTSPVYELDTLHPPRPMPAPNAGDWVFLRGTIVYADIFGQMHTTTFMQRVEGKFLHWANLGNTMT